MNDREIRTNAAHDAVIGKVIESASDKLLSATPPMRTFRLFGFDIKYEINLNTIVLVLTLISFIGGGSVAAYEVLRVPFQTQAETKELRAEMGERGTGHYLPKEIHDIQHRQDVQDARDNAMDAQLKLDHSDTLLAIESLHTDLLASRKDTSDHLDRLDSRIDRLVESESTAPHRR